MTNEWARLPLYVNTPTRICGIMRESNPVNLTHKQRTVDTVVEDAENWLFT